jgi:hypothetical protein
MGFRSFLGRFGWVSCTPKKNHLAVPPKKNHLAVPPKKNSRKALACGNSVVIPGGSGSGRRPRLQCGPIG